MNDGGATRPDPRTEEAARAAACLIGQWGEGWNAHDIGSLAALVTADVAFVNVAGKRLLGREEFREHHQTIHRAQLRESTWRTLGWEWCHLPGAQLLTHVEWMIRGERDATSLPRAPRSGVFTWLLISTKAGCRIRAAHNTDMREGIHHRTEGGLRARLELEGGCP